MQLDNGYLLGAVAVAAGITFLLRLTPFLLKGVLKESELLENLGAWIPLGAMIVLACYVFFSIDYSSPETALPYLAGAAVTIVVHLWRRNMIASMVAGTVVCVVLANWI